MSRIPRGQQARFVCHVINRGNGRSTIFHKAQDSQAFLPILALAVLIALIGGCQPMRGTVRFEETYYIGREPKVRVRLDRPLMELWEVSTMWGGIKRGEFDVGRAIFHVLENDPTSSVSLQYLSSGLASQVKSVYVDWRVFQASYKLKVLAHRPGGLEIITALGNASSTESWLQATQLAIEEALIDLTRQLAPLT